MTEMTWGGKSLFPSNFQIIVIIQKVKELQQGRQLEAGVEAAARVEFCLLDCSSCVAQPAFLYSTQGDLPRDGTARSELGPPSSVVTQASPQLDWWRHFLS